MTNGWQLTQILQSTAGLIPLDHSQIPNFFQYASPLVKNQSYDPGNKYTAAWQSGFTGIAYDPRLTKREITSVHDLLDPAVQGPRRDDERQHGARSAGMLALGIDLTTRRGPTGRRRRRCSSKQRRQGMVRQYYDQSYIKALENGDTWITQAWSGDIFQARAPAAIPTSSSSCRRRA